MNSLARVLTQKIAADFLEDHDAVALGNTNHETLRQLLGSQYRMKGRIDYQVFADRDAGVARICEMPSGFTIFDHTRVYPTIAVSQSLPFNPERKTKGWIMAASFRAQPHSLRFQKAVDEQKSDSDEAIGSKTYAKYRIGYSAHIRLARSWEPRNMLTEVWEKPEGRTIDSEDEEREQENHRINLEDDGRQGRPELAHFDFLPASVKQLDISKTILLSPQVTMSILHRVESLTLGTLWPWQLTPSAASSYWPPQLKQLKFKRWIKFKQDLGQLYRDVTDNPRTDTSGVRFFGEIDIVAITFPSTLTELELPEMMYELFDEGETKRLNAIQYPSGLTRLIRPLIPSQLEDWRLPESLTHLELEFDPDVPDHDTSHLVLPSSLLTLAFTEHARGETNVQYLASIRLPSSLTSLQLTYGYRVSLEAIILPASLTEIKYAREVSLPHDWSHTGLTSLTIHPPCQQLSAFKLPPSLTRLIFSQSDCTPQVPAEGTWPSHLRDIKIVSAFRDPLFPSFASPPLVFPTTLRRLILRSTALRGLLSQLKLPEGLESLKMDVDGPAVEMMYAMVLPSTLKEFTFHGPSVQISKFDHTQLVTLELGGYWNHSAITRPGEFELPSTLRSLRFSDSFNQPLDQLCLPAGLTELQFGLAFNQSLAPLANQVLSHLQILSFGVTTPNLKRTHLTHLSSLMDWHLLSTLHEIVIPSPLSPGLVDSTFHTRYTDFVNQLQKRVVMVKLISSEASKEQFV